MNNISEVTQVITLENNDASHTPVDQSSEGHVKTENKYKTKKLRVIEWDELFVWCDGSG